MKEKYGILRLTSSHSPPPTELLLEEGGIFDLQTPKGRKDYQAFLSKKHQEIVTKTASQISK